MTTLNDEADICRQQIARLEQKIKEDTEKLAGWRELLGRMGVNEK